MAARWIGPRRLLPAVMFVLCMVIGIPDHHAAASSTPKKSDPSLAQVRYILRGLGERSPKGRWIKGRVHDRLVSGSGVRTQRRQRASIEFQDGTLFHINQQTEATLLTPHRTVVSRGEVNEVVVPGTNHRVVTAAASASAIGTSFDVRIAGKVTIVAVVEGAVVVHNARGTVLVKAGQETRVQAGKKPAAPIQINPSSIIAWTKPLPQPSPQENVALDANGGSADASSAWPGDNNQNLWPAPNVNDGSLSTGWESDAGDLTPTITVALDHGAPYLISRIIVDPAATHGQPDTTDLKDFSVAVSLWVDNPGQFKTVVLHGSCRQQNALQTFVLPKPEEATYAQVKAVSNYGDPVHTSIAEIEVVGTAVQPSPGTWSVVGSDLNLQSPTGIAEDGAGNLYVAEDSNPYHIDKLSPTGALLAQWGSSGSDPGQLDSPQGLAVDGQGNVYVADRGNNRIQKFGPDGTPLAQWGTFGTDPGQFNDPYGVALDGAGNIYVSDAVNNRVQKLSPTGQPLAQWSVDGQQPEGIAVDRDGNVYVALWAEDRIEKLSPDGTELAKIEASGTAVGELSAPWGVALDAQGDIYVTEDDNNRIQEFSPALSPLHRWGIGGHDVGQLHEPEGIVVSPDGTIFVADNANGRLQKLVPGK